MATPDDTGAGPSPFVIRGRHTLLDYLFFTRPALLPPVWTIALLGTLAGGGHPALTTWRWLIFFAHLSCLFGGVYTLNQICDVESDRINRKLIFLPEGIISPGAAWRFTVALDLLALALSLLFGWRFVLLTAALIVLGVVYSVGSRPWKNRPLLGLGANAVGHGLLVYWMGQEVAGAASEWQYGRAAPYLAAVAAVYLATTVPDRDGDLAAGKATAAVAWGTRPTTVAAAMLAGISILGGWWQDDGYLLLAGTAALPFFILGTVDLRRAAGAAKAAVLSLSLAAVVAYPYYLVLLAAGFVGTRLFFRWRFDLSYPTLNARG